MSTAVAKVNESTIDSILSKITQMEQSGGLTLPKDYSAENALKSAWLILQETKTSKSSGEKPVLEACTKASIANSLLDMVVQGLNPVKKQCYFIAYGNSLTMSRSYMGTVAVAKRYGDISETRANVIYKDDEFEFEIDPLTGDRKVVKHKQTLSSLSGEIIGAYAILSLNDGRKYVEIMNMQQIRNAWNRGIGKGQSQAHKEHPEEMSKKTVIGRACKLFINTSSDAALFDDEEDVRRSFAGASNEITNNANKGDEIGFDDPIEIEAKESVNDSNASGSSETGNGEPDQVDLAAGF